MRPIATTGVLAGCALVVVSQLYLTIPLLDPIAADLGVPTSTASWAGSAFAFAFAAGNLLFAAVSDARGRRRVMTGGLWALAAATVLVAVAPDVQVLVIARAVQGLVGAAVPAVAMVYVSETLRPVARARALSAIGAAFLSASVLGQVYADAASDVASWRWAFAATAPLMLAGGFMVRRLPEEVERAPQRIAGALAALPRVLVRPALRRPFFAATVLLLTLVAMYSGMADTAAREASSSGSPVRWIPG